MNRCDIGDIVVATEVRNGADIMAACSSTGAGSARAGAVASIDHIAQTAAEKRNLRRPAHR